MKNRIESLNYLRGVLAILVMLYHYSLWMNITPDLSQPLCRISLYGVSMFYIISGITNYLSYQQCQYKLKHPVVHFACKRLWRIVPLFSFITVVTWLLNFKKNYDTQTIVLNITALFGFFDPSHYIAVGAWSVGNLMVYYAVFPLAVYLYQCHYRTFLLLLAFSFMWTVYLSFFVLSDTKPLPIQWAVYSNPFNNLVFFLGGIYISRVISDKKETAWVWRLLILAVLLLFFTLPLKNSPIHMVTGVNRILYLSLTFIFILLLLRLPIRLPGILHHLFSAFGLHSYSFYLWHPVCFMLVSGANKTLHAQLAIEEALTVAFVCTMIVSYFSRKYIEQSGPYR